MIEGYLADPDYRVISVHDGMEAVETYRSGDVDLILMDIRMPRLNGLEATEKIRSIERERGRPAVPIVAMTADVLDETREMALQAGCTHWLPKPTSRDQLLLMVHHALNQSEGEHETTEEEKVPATTAPDNAALATLFIEESRKGIEKIREQLQGRQWEALSESAHALKGNALILGLQEQGEIMRRIQQQAERREPATIEPLLEQFTTRINEMEQP